MAWGTETAVDQRSSLAVHCLMSTLAMMSFLQILWGVYVCVCVCMCVCVGACMCMCVSSFVCVCIYIYLFIYLFIYMYVIYEWMHVTTDMR